MIETVKLTEIHLDIPRLQILKLPTLLYAKETKILNEVTFDNQLNLIRHRYK